LLGAFGLLGAIQQGVVLGPLTRKIGEVRVLQGGLLLAMIGFIGTALSAQIWVFVFFSALFNFGNALLQPSVASLVSQRATTGQGVTMGLQNSFSSLGRAVGPLWAGSIYDVWQEFPFLSGALFQAIGLAASFFAMRESRVPSAAEELAGK
jgi:DHA1 family multidrug resistance protein-like MFS transporter